MILLSLIILIVTNKIDVKKKSSSEEVVEKSNNKENLEKSAFEITYKEETYISKNPSEYVISTNKRNLPVIASTKDSLESVANIITDILTDISNAGWTSVKLQADDYSNDLFREKEENLNLGIEYLFNTGVITDNRLTFNLTMSGGFLSSEYTGYNFDAKTGELLTLDKISKDVESANKLKQTIKDEVNNYIKNVNIYDDISDLDSEISKLISTNGNWYFKDNCIEIALPKYEVSPGLIRIEINNSKINEFIKDEYKI